MTDETKDVYFKKILAYKSCKNYFGEVEHWMCYEFKDYIKRNLFRIKKFQVYVDFYKKERQRLWEHARKNRFAVVGMSQSPTCLMLYGYRKLLKDEEVKRKQIKDFIKANESMFARMESAKKFKEENK